MVLLFNKGTIMFKIWHKSLPVYLCELFSRPATKYPTSRLNFSVPRHRIEIYQQSLSYSGAHLWNSLPTHIKQKGSSRKVYSHTSCQHHRCHLILICPLWPIRGFGDMASANERSAITGPMAGDNKTFLQILFPSSDSPGKTTLRHCLDWNQRNWSPLSLHFTFRAKVFWESVRKVITL